MCVYAHICVYISTHQLGFSSWLSTFDLCAYILYMYIICVSNQKFSSTVDRRPPVHTIIHILHVYNIVRIYVICSSKRERWYKIQYIYYVCARMYGLPVCRCVPNNRNNITKPVASARPAAGSMYTHSRIYMCVYIRFFFLMKSPSTVYTDVRPEIYRAVFYRPCAVGLAIFPDRHRYSAAITL